MTSDSDVEEEEEIEDEENEDCDDHDDDDDSIEENGEEKDNDRKEESHDSTIESKEAKDESHNDDDDHEQKAFRAHVPSQHKETKKQSDKEEEIPTHPPYHVIDENEILSGNQTKSVSSYLREQQDLCYCFICLQNVWDPVDFTCNRCSNRWVSNRVIP